MIAFVAWQFVRVIGLWYFVLGYTISLFYHPSPCSHDKGERDAFNLLMSSQMQGAMMFQSKSPDDFPKIIADKMLLIGKLMVGTTVIFLFTSVLPIIVGGK